MAYRLTRIYTATGDKGTTALANGTRLAKDHPRIEAMGAIDELNSQIGLLLTEEWPDVLRVKVGKIQHDLFDLGAELSLPDHDRLPVAATEWLADWLEQLNTALPPLAEFVLPGGHRAAAACQVTRAVCRRAERRLVTLNRQEPVSPQCLKYLNILADVLFVLGRTLNQQTGYADILWRPSPTP